MKIKIRDTSEKIEVSNEVFGREFKKSLIHQVVTSYLNNSRQGTKAQKNYKSIRGGGKKPWKQKGTGRARAGSVRSPLWRGGCITFAAKTQKNYNKINKKMYKLAMCAIMSELIRQKRLIVLNKFTVNIIKTKIMIMKLKAFNIKNFKSLIITETVDDKINISLRNIPNVNPINVGFLNPVSIINTDKVLITLSALRILEEQLKI